MNPSQLTLAAFATVAIAAASPHPAAAQSALTVAFEGIKTQKGAIMVALYDTEAAFDGGKPVSVAMIPATAARVETKIAGLAPGRYAVKAFHDVDGDGKMGTNPFGMPTEPFAFSNNAVGMMGPAKWPAAAFMLDAASAAHTMTID
ncbi:DUF2141 domain-containing protein [Phenylobacterium sp.]|uniref:DUF2141 domain-containing protein n=1 Tax=Phenylobacterium sp. TaxID=1871053 RepID=UPI00273300CC|nr:DUF2141 domain-containing protein [Phenylobacterium sp.]MDP3853945.1 DUF2141 domain-containing protein [Phenylobacterium sp.]